MKAATISDEHAQQQDADDPLRSYRDEFHIPRHDIPSSHHRELRTAAMNLWAKIARA